jgi:hypothetical protein
MQEEKEILRRLNRGNLYWVVGRWYILWVGQILTETRPSDLLLPTTLTQVALFFCVAVFSEKFLIHFTIGNLVIVSLAMSPILFRAPRAHWVK